MNEDTIPEQATFESFLEALKWRVVRRENDRVIIERVETGKQIKIQEVSLVWSESLGDYEQVTKIVEMDDGGFSIS